MTVEVDEKEDKEGWSLGDFVATVLRTMKLLWDVLLVFTLGGLLFGAGIAIGYAASLFNETETPDPTQLVQQVRNISSVSKISYSDGSIISDIDSDLIRIPVQKMRFRTMSKRLLLPQRMRILIAITGLFRKQ